MAKSKSRRKFLVFAAILLVLGGLSTVAFFQKREPLITVQTTKVARRNLTELVVANGKIQPVLQVKISPEVSGEIIELPVKEGQHVKKGDLIVRIKPDFYIATRNQAEASYKSSVAGKATAEANLKKAVAEFRRAEDLYAQKLISDSVFDDIGAGYSVATAQLTSSTHQVEMAKAQLESAEEQLAKTKIVAPLNGTVSKLNSQLGERVLGTVQNMGTEIMIIADLNEMEARVDIGEIDVVLMEPGQNVRLEVDAFKNKKFTGTVTEVANSSKSSAFGGGSSAQEATKFEVKIRVKEKENFRPGMSVTAEIETRSRTNALTVPIASVTTRVPKPPKEVKGASGNGNTNAPANTIQTNGDERIQVATKADKGPNGTNSAKADRKSREAAKPIEVVFIKDGDRAKMRPVKIGISDDDYWEVVEGLEDGQEVISGGFRAISRDLEDGKKIRIGPPVGEKPEDGKNADRERETET